MSLNRRLLVVLWMLMLMRSSSSTTTNRRLLLLSVNLRRRGLRVVGRRRQSGGRSWGGDLGWRWRRRGCHRRRRLRSLHRHLLHLRRCSRRRLLLLLCGRLLLLLRRRHGHSLRSLCLHHRLRLSHGALSRSLVRRRPLRRRLGSRLVLRHSRRLMRPPRHRSLQLALLHSPVLHEPLAVGPELPHSLHEAAVKRQPLLQPRRQLAEVLHRPSHR